MGNKIEELDELKRKLSLGGGDKNISEQHNKGKLTARERLNLFFDEGTFIETGMFINSLANDDNKASGVVTGYGQVNGRLVYAFSDDFTILNGSFSKVHLDKIIKCQEDAVKLGVPIVYMYDSSGFRIEEGIETLSYFGKVLKNISKIKGLIPQITIVFGQCAGSLSFAASLTDFVFMVNKTSKMFLTGAEALTDYNSAIKDEKKYADADTHSKITGLADFALENENECINEVRELLSYLPQNNAENAEEVDLGDDLNRMCTSLDSIDFDKSYDVKNIITEIADKNTFFEVRSEYAKNIITCFIHLGGMVVAVIANNKNVLNGELDIASAKKAEGFIRICNMFNIPILLLVDSDGFVKTSIEENSGNIKYAGDMIFAYSNAEVPMVTLIINKAIGSSYICMGCKEYGVDEVLSWPNAKISVMNEKMLSNILNKNIDEVNDIVSPYTCASLGLVDDIIKPSETRMRLILTFDKLLTKGV